MLMLSIPRETHCEILSYLEREEQQMYRLVSKHALEIIKPSRVHLLDFGATRGIVEYCSVGLSRRDTSEKACMLAAKNGHLEVLKYLRSAGCPWDKWVCNYAAKHGHLEVIKYAMSAGCPCDIWTCSYAAKHGHLEVLKYVRSSGYPCDVCVCIDAARNGHLEVLKYARKSGCPWDSRVCAYAARNGHLEILRWAVDNDCPRRGLVANLDQYPRHIQEYVLGARH